MPIFPPDLTSTYALPDETVNCKKTFSLTCCNTAVENFNWLLA